MKIDIYDFDKTIVPFDSGSLFCGYCALRYPYIMLLFPVQLIGIILSVLHIITFTQYKKFCFCFVPFIPLDRAVRGFWDRHEKDVHKWFYDRENYTVVISASPDFLLEDIAKRLRVDRLICSRHNRKTGAIIGENCRGEEKVRRLYEVFDKNELEVESVYSDSLRHDRPIFSLGKNCINIVNGEKKPFDYGEVYTNVQT